MTGKTLPEPPMVPKPPMAPTPLAGLGVAAVVVAAISGWVAVGGFFLSEPSLFAGFMVLWYWAKVDHLAKDKLPDAILGSLAGVGIAWIMHSAAVAFGGPGFAVGLAVLIAAIYLDIIAVWPRFVNAATMLFSIVAAAPLVQFHVNWVELGLATLGGGLFFGAFVVSAAWLAAKLAKRAV